MAIKTYSSIPGSERAREVVCNSCGSTQVTEALVDDHYRFVRCATCRLVFQSPQPLLDDLRDRYDDNYFDYEIENENAFVGLMHLGLRDAGFEALTATDRVRTMLDVGCATGRLLMEMREAGWEVAGVDVCRESVQFGRRERGLDIRLGTLDEADFEPEQFSVVHGSHVIEHVVDPTAFLTDIRSLLVPGGYVFITTPNIDGFQARLFGNRWRSAIADHMYLFSKRTLRAAFERAGLQVIRSATWGGLAAGTAPAPVKKLADRLVKPLGVGDVVMMVGRRPE